MTPQENQPALEQLREDVALLRDQLHQLAAQLARIDTRTETHGLALDDIETYVTQTAQLTHPAPEHTTTANGAQGGEDVKTGPGVDMSTLVPWVENNITTLIARKVPTTDGAPKWCQHWWDHAEAIARLEAARQAWTALSGAGGTSLVTYFDYLDRVVLAPLTSDTGPFARCGPRHHTPERPLGHTPPPPEIYAEIHPEVYPDPTPAATHPVLGEPPRPITGS